MIEAMAAGLPIVTTDCSGVVELVDHEVNGLIVPCGDLDQAYEALARLFRDPVLGRG